MPSPGRPPTPRATKLRLGNPGHRPLHPEPEPDLLSVEQASVVPARLAEDPDAIEYWQAHAPRLAALRLLTVLDVDRFAMGCYEAGRYWANVRLLQEHGEVFTGRWGPTLRPEVALAAQHLRAACAILRDFGLSPVDRARLVTTPTTSGDPMESLLRRTEGA